MKTCKKDTKFLLSISRYSSIRKSYNFNYFRTQHAAEITPRITEKSRRQTTRTATPWTRSASGSWRTRPETRSACLSVSSTCNRARIAIWITWRFERRAGSGSWSAFPAGQAWNRSNLPNRSGSSSRATAMAWRRDSGLNSAWWVGTSWVDPRARSPLPFIRFRTKEETPFRGGSPSNFNGRSESSLPIYLSRIATRIASPTSGLVNIIFEGRI